MTRSYNTIETDVAHARNSLASTLDELAARLSPKALADEGKAQAKSVLADPTVKMAMAGIGAVIGAVVVGVLVRQRNERKAFERYLQG